MPRARAAAVPVTDADELPPDPQPGERRRGRPRGSTSRPKIIARAPSGKVLSRAQMVGMVTTEIHAVLAMAVNVWAFRDPYCAGAFQDTVMTATGEKDRLEAIAEQFADMIGRNDALLATFAKGGVLLNAGMLLNLLAAPVKTVIKAHGPGGHGHKEEEPEEPDYAQYNAPAFAG